MAATDLPPDREKALERIAQGWGRIPTQAHPDCICNKPIPGTVDPRWEDHEGNPVPKRGQKKDCPLHGDKA